MRRTEEKIARRIDFSEAMRLGREKVWTLDPGGLDPIQYFTDEPAALPPPAPSEVVELKEAAEAFAIKYEPWMDEHGDDVPAPMARVTLGQVRRLRAAIAAVPMEGES